MAGNLENFLEQGGCIPEDVLMNYAEGKLKQQEANAVEKHLLECAFCADALEGLKMLSPARSMELTSFLNKEIDKRVQSVKGSGMQVIPFRMNYRIAAVITLFVLFGAGYLYFKNHDNENMLAQTNSPATIVVTDSVAPQLVPQSYSDQKPAETIPSRPQFSLAGKSPDAASGENLTDAKNEQSAVVVTEAENKTAKDREEIAVPSASGVSQADEGMPSAATVSKEVGAASARQKSAKNAEGEKAPALESVAYRKIAANDQFSLNVLFTKAKNNYKQKKFTEAAIDFEKVVGDTAAVFHDDAKWMLANCYMRTSRNSKAVLLLREIAHSNSIHQKEAEGLLQEIQ